LLDQGFVRQNIELVERGVKAKGERVDLKLFLELDRRWRELLAQADSLKHQRNVASQRIGQLVKEDRRAEEEIIRMRELGQRIKGLDEEVRALEARLREVMLSIPNLPHPSVPVGRGDEDNMVVKTWGERPEFDFPPRDHLQLGRLLGLFDFARGSKLAGSGFPLYRDFGAKLERALLNFMLDLHTQKHGYTEVSPPFLANRGCMEGTGQLPKLEEDMYLCEHDDLFLIPTAEVPVTNLHREEILNGNQLPLKYAAYTPCFRREAGSYGKETKGFLRVHQFDKVELVKFVRPEDSYQELEDLLNEAEEVLKLLKLSYQVRLLCTGDLSFAAAKCYDIDVWAPVEGKYLEVSSCSNYEDFQARRSGIRFREGRKVKFVHTLNGSGVATARLLVALLETYQTKETELIVPSLLRPYLEGRERIG
jgi:seryl-tRNA synthetase